MKAQMRMSVFTEVYAIYEQDTKETFNYEHELGILKDQPRWKEPLNESSSKRSKISSLREGGGGTHHLPTLRRQQVMNMTQHWGWK